MKTLKIWPVMICLVLLPSPSLADKSVTLSTYYPAPFGAYDRLKLVPRETFPLKDHCNNDKDIGTMYYDNGENKVKAGLYVCQKLSGGKFIWTQISQPEVAMEKAEEADWQKDLRAMAGGKVLCVKEDGTFGGCMTNPSYDGTCACQ